MLRACSHLLAVGVVLASLPAVAEPPAAKAQPGDAPSTLVVRSLPADAVNGTLTPSAVGAAAGFSTTASVLSGAAATFAISISRDVWATSWKPCGKPHRPPCPSPTR